MMPDLTERKFQSTKPEIAPGAQCIPNPIIQEDVSSGSTGLPIGQIILFELAKRILEHPKYFKMNVNIFS